MNHLDFKNLSGMMSLRTASRSAAMDVASNGGTPNNIFSGESGGAVQAGVGIFFQQEADGSVYVKTIVNSGSAERDGVARVGDMIVAVDDRQVIGEPLSLLRSLILGPQGTYVKLTFQRREGGEIRQYETRLMRGTADYFQGISRQMTMEDELDQMRLQLRQAISHCTQDRDELDRLRKMLQSERDASARREREIEQMQHSNAEELTKLNENLRKAEQVRREAEIKLHPLQQREADLIEELNRQREKERLRKELKKRHEDEKTRLEQLFLKEQAGRREDQVCRLSAEALLNKIQVELARLREFEQARRENEDDYRQRVEQELERLSGGSRMTEQLRGLTKDVESKFSRAHADYFSAPHYQPDDDCDDQEDNFFLG